MTSSLPILSLPLLVMIATITYPAAGRHAVVVSSPQGQAGAALGWLARHGARLSGRTAGGGAVIRLPSDGLALHALARGILLVAAPSALCGAADRAR